MRCGPRFSRVPIARWQRRSLEAWWCAASPIGRYAFRSGNGWCEHGARCARVRDDRCGGSAGERRAANTGCVEQRAIRLIVQRRFAGRSQIRGDNDCAFMGRGSGEVEVRAGCGELQHECCEYKPDCCPGAAGAQSPPQWLEAGTVHGIRLHAGGRLRQTNPHRGPRKGSVQRFVRGAFGAAEFLDRLADRPPQADAGRVAFADHCILITRCFAQRFLAVTFDEAPGGASDVGVWIEVGAFRHSVQTMHRSDMKHYRLAVEA